MGVKEKNLPVLTTITTGSYVRTLDGDGKSQKTLFPVLKDAVTPGEATTSAAGLMSATDKAKLDGIEAEANKTVVDSALSDSSTNPVQNKVVEAAITDLKDEFSDEVVNVFPSPEIKTNYWNNGKGISPTDGALANSTSRCACGLWFGQKTGEIMARALSGYEFAVYKYTAEGAYVGILHNDNTFSPTSDGTVVKYVTTYDFQNDYSYKYRIVFRNAVNTSATITSNECIENCRIISSPTLKNIVEPSLNRGASICDFDLSGVVDGYIDKNAYPTFSVGSSSVTKTAVHLFEMEPHKAYTVVVYGHILSSTNTRQWCITSKSTGKVVANGNVVGENVKFQVIDCKAQEPAYFNISYDENARIVDVSQNDGDYFQNRHYDYYNTFDSGDRLAYIIQRVAKYGDTIHVPNGEYEFHHPVYIPFGVSLELEEYAVIKAADDFYIPDDVNRRFLLTYDGGSAFDNLSPTKPGSQELDNNTGISIKGGILDGNGIVSCLRISGAHHITISNVGLHNGKQYGLSVWGYRVYEAIISNCYAKTFVEGCEGNTGFYISQHDNHLIDCICVDYTIGFHIAATANRLTRCHAWGGIVGYPESHPTLDDSINFKVTGASNTFVSCYADTAEIGVDISSGGDGNMFFGMAFYNNYSKFGLDNVTYINDDANNCVFIGGTMIATAPNTTKISGDYVPTMIGCIGFE